MDARAAGPSNFQKSREVTAPPAGLSIRPLTEKLGDVLMSLGAVTCAQAHYNEVVRYQGPHHSLMSRLAFPIRVGAGDASVFTVGKDPRVDYTCNAGAVPRAIVFNADTTVDVYDALPWRYWYDVNRQFGLASDAPLRPVPFFRPRESKPIGDTLRLTCITATSLPPKKALGR